MRAYIRGDLVTRTGISPLMPQIVKSQNAFLFLENRENRLMGSKVWQNCFQSFFGRKSGSVLGGNYFSFKHFFAQVITVWAVT
jgi:hypothetical protein